MYESIVLGFCGRYHSLDPKLRIICLPFKLENPNRRKYTVLTEEIAALHEVVFIPALTNNRLSLQVFLMMKIQRLARPALDHRRGNTSHFFRLEKVLNGSAVELLCHLTFAARLSK